MATVSKWNPYGVALNITATASTITRTSATQYTVKIAVSWEAYYSNARTNYGMSASSGGSSVTISAFGTSRHEGSSTLTGTYSISGNGSASKTITVTFTNYKEDGHGTVTGSATNTVSFTVTVPAWTSYTVSYNANGGTGAPGNQTKWKNQTLTLSSTKPTRTGYTFLGWATSSTATSATYSAGGSYTANSAATLYAVWKAVTYTVSYNANGGTGAPGNQTKTYGVTLTLSTTKPARTDYNFLGWGTSASATTVVYSPGGSYTANAAVTLYAIWELAYKKPTISGLSISRCSSDGTLADDGTCVLVKFSWSTYLNLTAITISWADVTGATSGSVSASGSGMSGSVSQVISDFVFDSETSYSFVITVADGDGDNRCTSVSATVTSTEFNIDFYENQATAIGKSAEQLYDEDGNAMKAFDVNWRAKFRDHVLIGEKVGHLDGKTGIFLSSEGYIHLQRSTAKGYHPYIGFMLDDDTAAQGMIRLNSSTGVMEFVSADGYEFGDYIATSGGLIFTKNNLNIYGYDTNGVRKNCFCAQNQNNGTIVGWGNYYDASGSTNVYGYDVNIGISNAAAKTTFRPYRRRGDSETITIRTSGYVTNNSTDVYFFVPYSVPIVGSPTITVTSTNGLTLRQDNKYTHGSGASTYAKPTSYTVLNFTQAHGFAIKAVFSTTTNAINNAPVGIDWNGTITFS